MHMPKRNLFAYLAATVLGICVMIVGFRGTLSETLGNIILVFFGGMMVVSGIITIIRYLRQKKK